MPAQPCTNGLIVEVTTTIIPTVLDVSSFRSEPSFGTFTSKKRVVVALITGEKTRSAPRSLYRVQETGCLLLKGVRRKQMKEGVSDGVEELSVPLLCGVLAEIKGKMNMVDGASFLV